MPIQVLTVAAIASTLLQRSQEPGLRARGTTWSIVPSVIIYTRITVKWFTLETILVPRFEYWPCTVVQSAMRTRTTAVECEEMNRKKMLYVRVRRALGKTKLEGYSPLDQIVGHAVRVGVTLEACE